MSWVIGVRKRSHRLRLFLSLFSSPLDTPLGETDSSAVLVPETRQKLRVKEELATYPWLFLFGKVAKSVCTVW